MGEISDSQSSKATGKTVSEYLLRILEIYGVECVFGIPGVHTAELYRALGQTSIQHITPRHEQGAGFAADGYARISGKPGVCLVITGPGLGNIVTAMGQAYADSIPLLVISSVNELAENRQGKGHLHELPNQSALLEQVAQFSYTVTSSQELLPVMARAFSVFEAGRPRPVHLEIPIDLMTQPANLTLPKSRPVFNKPHISPECLTAMNALCAQAKHPVILAGGGARHASKTVRAVAEKLNAPVITTVNARGLLSKEHPLSINASASLEPLRQLIEQADLILALGTELGPTDYDIWRNGGMRIQGKLIRVDIAADQLHKNYTADLAVLSDVESAMRELLAELPQRSCHGLKTQVNKTHQLLAQQESPEYARSNRCLAAIWEVLPDAIVVGDSTEPVYAGNDITTMPDTARWFNSATGFGTLGYALPAAIGAKRACAHRPVVAIAGDGGVQFSLAELATAKQAALPLTLLISNNGGYGEIKSHMNSAGIDPVSVELWTPDFSLIAKAYGWELVRVTSVQELQSAVKRGFDAQLNLMILGFESIDSPSVDEIAVFMP